MADLKQHGKGEPFFPGHILKEAVVMLLTIIIVMFLAVTIDLPNESVADPTDTSYIPRPEWYFLFLFQFLKYFPGSMEVVAAVLFPAAFIGLLLFLPFLDKNPARHPKKRPLATSSAIVTMVGIIVLTILGMDDGSKNTQHTITFFEKWKYGVIIAIIFINYIVTWMLVSKNSPVKDSAAKAITASVLAVLSIIAISTVVVFSALEPNQVKAAAGEGNPGKDVLLAKCTSCHKFEGQGADFAPDLSKGPKKYKGSEEIAKFLKDPASVGSGMPKQQLTDDEIKQLADFLASLQGADAGSSSGAAVETSGSTNNGGGGNADKGKSAVETNCIGCHAVNGKGGTAGPDLAKVVANYDENKLKEFLNNPSAVKPGTPMPKLPLAEEDLNNIVTYLMSLKGTNKTDTAQPSNNIPSGNAQPLSQEKTFEFAIKTIEANSCKSCHKIKGDGGSFAPDLSKVGSYRDKDYIVKFLTNPKAVNPNTQMPTVPLSKEEINAVASYLASLK